MMKFVDISAATLQGTRDYQEDSFYVGPHGLVVCDGMGGHEDGGLASQAACSSIADRIQDQSATAVPQRVFADALQAIDKSPAGYYSGTTASYAQIVGGELVCSHVGDSPIWVLDGSGTSLLRFYPHNVSGEAYRMGRIASLDRASASPLSNRITSYLGPRVRAPDKIETDRFTAQAGMVVLVASDGLHCLSEEEILGYMAEALHGASCESVVLKLCDEVSQSPALSDNTTFVLGKVG